MAGNYPDVPAPRMAYDRDGSVTLFGTAQQTNVSVKALNDETTDTFIATLAVGDKVTVVFPQKRDLAAIYMRSIANSAALVETSANTTSGQDGTWTTLVADFNDGTPAYRNDIRTVSGAAATGINAIRFYPASAGSTWQPTVLHLYGSIAAGFTPDRLSFWHPTLDQEVDGAYFDFGDIPRTTFAVKDFRLKNRSTTLTASNILVDDEVLTDTTPALAPQYTYSSDGGTTYTDTLAAGSLAPGVISQVFKMKLTKPADATLGLWVARHNAVAATFA